MKKFIKQTYENFLSKDGIFYRDVIAVVAAAIFFCIIICLFFYTSTLKNVKEQVQKTEISDLEMIGNMIDRVCDDTKTMTHFLAADSDVNIYFQSETPIIADREYNLKIKNKISTLNFMYPYINSIYLYTQNNDILCSSKEGFYTADDYFDNEWMEKIKEKEADGKITIYPRTLNNNYPYLITFIKKLNVNDSLCAVVINVDIFKLLEYLNIDKEDGFFIVYNNSIIYKKNMTDMFLNIKEIPSAEYLLKDDTTKANLFQQDGEKYISTITKAKGYEWYYVCVNSADGYLKEIENKSSLIYIFIFIVIAFCLFLIFKYIKDTYRPIQLIEDLIDNNGIVVNKKNVSPKIRALADKILRFVNLNYEMRTELEQKLVNLRKLQLQVMQIQMSPHFLFNTLNTIYMQSIEDFDHNHKVSKMLLLVSEYLRYILESENELTDVKTEIHYTKIYAEILKYRYPKLKNINWEFEESIDDLKILKICLQPIVENAVYHGICGKKGDFAGELSVKGYKKDEMLIFEIFDNGIGITEEKLRVLKEKLDKDLYMDSKHIGVVNINKRIQLLYGKKYGVEIQSEYGVGTTVFIKHPIVSPNGE